jgi:hypothetical protein
MPSNSTLANIREQSAWYGKRARINRHTFFALKTVQIVMAAAIPVVSLGSTAVNLQRWTNALLGALIGILEGVLQLGQYQQNWLLYRATREALRREELLYSANAGPYTGQSDSDVLYVERSDAIMSGESSRWLASQEQRSSSPKSNS